MTKSFHIVLNAIPVLCMVGLIPFVQNDILLTLVYCVIIVAALLLKRNQHDVLVLVLGFVIMVAFEYLFIRTGVETFNRRSLFGVMPLWLPFLWSYGFVAIARAVRILDSA